MPAAFDDRARAAKIADRGSSLAGEILRSARRDVSQYSPAYFIKMSDSVPICGSTFKDKTASCGRDGIVIRVTVGIWLDFPLDILHIDATLGQM
jgi:hypothetical protein